MPISAPMPTADIGCDLVKISASAPMPTSRYCDHACCSISTSLSRIASGEPGCTLARLSPITETMALRTDSAFAGSPRACSSMTRSSMLDTKVTPLALIACRSQGARNQGTPLSRRCQAELASVSASGASAGRPVASRSTATGSSNSKKALVVAATRERSYTLSPRTQTTAGPFMAGSHARPISSARS